MEIPINFSILSISYSVNSTEAYEHVPTVSALSYWSETHGKFAISFKYLYDNRKTLVK